MSVLESTLNTSSPDGDSETLDTAASPSRKTPGGCSGSNSKSWSPREATDLLKLFFLSAFFVLPKASENVLNAAEACKKVIIQNLIERILVGVDLDIFKAGGSWGKVLNSAIKSRQEVSNKAGHHLDQTESDDGSPIHSLKVTGLHGLPIPPPVIRPVAGSKSYNLEAHSKAHMKAKLQVQGGKNGRSKSEALPALESADTGKGKKASEWFEIDGFVYQKGIKLNPAFISKSSGRETIFLPFLNFADPRCDATTRLLAEKLGVTDIRQWTFRLSDLEAKSLVWSRPVSRSSAQLDAAALSVRAAKLLNGGDQLPKFNLELQPTCIVDNNTDWFSVYLSKPGGFQSVADIRFIVKTEPRAECLLIQPAEGVTGPEYICNEVLGATPEKVHIKRKFCQLQKSSQPLDGWADITIPLPIRQLNLKKTKKKLIENGMILLIIQKLVPEAEEVLIEL